MSPSSCTFVVGKQLWNFFRLEHHKSQITACFCFEFLTSKKV